jgi:hypothetical protein
MMSHNGTDKIANPSILLVGSHPGDGNESKKGAQEKNKVTNPKWQKSTQKV